MDVLLVGFIAGFIYGGYRTGFLKRLIGIVFMVIAFVASAYFRYPVGAIASTFFKDIPADYADLVGYVIAFPVILAGLHIAGQALIGKVQIQGITEGVDKGLGAVLGGFEALLIVSAGIVILDTYFGTSSSLDAFHAGYLNQLTEAVNGSETVHLLRDTTVPLVLAVLGPILPKDVSTIVSTGLPSRLPFPTP